MGARIGQSRGPGPKPVEVQSVNWRLLFTIRRKSVARGRGDMLPVSQRCNSPLAAYWLDRWRRISGGGRCTKRSSPTIARWNRKAECRPPKIAEGVSGAGGLGGRPERTFGRCGLV